ncbi:hypothetical protein MUDAN_BIHEEGNE_02870 [Lactiplantibacillus mudanjiangensis]|uniref:Uncharacterized protein n=1 Tax=Lactiplantibacillus mudanjiangensis TaxID=1296538 RepID=A0A660E3T0_9LACO|nr:hypothetical protein MUDAN_BIHEEGNE_02870 [Lactiplantibacillus mudanjiangensis]VDG22814.1 hypothetical protein MUDAN_IGPPGNFN_00355 [Lactiplantibacillus mudanjiangensis]VDG26614.1 hypothetical protein MUDAN_MDHGFNIF_00053 [Lactiplantibacillus mudanjiangensis]VDG31848.1 hypothetical protein MUDAN_DOGOELCO_01138 [Lactiplantibacillus mudanjiangensis]
MAILQILAVVLVATGLLTLVGDPTQSRVKHPKRGSNV